MLGTRVLKDFIVQKIESIIDEEKSVKHSKLSEQAEQVILDPAKVRSARERVGCMRCLQGYRAAWLPPAAVLQGTDAHVLGGAAVQRCLYGARLVAWFEALLWGGCGVIPWKAACVHWLGHPRVAVLVTRRASESPVRAFMSHMPQSMGPFKVGSTCTPPLMLGSSISDR